MARLPWRVRDRATFERLRRSPLRARRGPLSVTWVPAADALVAEGDQPRVAFAIGRRVGTAVARNRLRRRLRAALAEADLAPGSYLVAAGPEAARLSWAELRSTLADVLTVLAERRR